MATCETCLADVPDRQYQGGMRQRFCSQRCQKRARRRELGLVWEPRHSHCGWCLAAFIQRRPSVLTCSGLCRSRRSAALAAKTPACSACGAIDLSRSRFASKFVCSACRKDLNRRKNTARRSIKSGTYTLVDIGARDGWRCHLCGRAVNPALSGAHARGPTIDHLVPVSQGGSDEPTNVRLAHRECNTRRGVRGTVQLLLVG
jgi:5-methylcytosine-specific restriction endonuclease McrA